MAVKKETVSLKTVYSKGGIFAEVTLDKEGFPVIRFLEKSGGSLSLWSVAGCQQLAIIIQEIVKDFAKMEMDNYDKALREREAPKQSEGWPFDCEDDLLEATCGHYGDPVGMMDMICEDTGIEPARLAEFFLKKGWIDRLKDVLEG